MTTQEFRALTNDARIEMLFSRSEEAIADLSILRREVKYVKTQLHYLKNRFEDYLRKGKKKEVAQCESNSSKTKSKKALTSSS